MPNFSYGTPVRDLFGAVVTQAQEAEAAGFDAVFVMDHFYQLPTIGAPDEPMLECYSALAGLAMATERIQLSALVTGNTYRNPALLAKTVTTLDVISRGRAVLGIGAGWYEMEHKAYGFEFGTFGERFEKLAESLDIVVPMLRGERPTLKGEWYRADAAMNEPRVRDDLPVLLGGGGERKTFALAARHADHLNLLCGASQIPDKLVALRQRCDEAGREPNTLETSFLAYVIADPDGDRAREMHAELLRKQATGDSAELPAAVRNVTLDRQFVGTPAEVAAQIRTRVLDHGVDGIVINMVVNGHRPGILDAVGKAMKPLVS